MKIKSTNEFKILMISLLLLSATLLSCGQTGNTSSDSTSNSTSNSESTLDPLIVSGVTNYGSGGLFKLDFEQSPTLDSSHEYSVQFKLKGVSTEFETIESYSINDEYSIEAGTGAANPTTYWDSGAGPDYQNAPYPRTFLLRANIVKNYSTIINTSNELEVTVTKFYVTRQGENNVLESINLTGSNVTHSLQLVGLPEGSTVTFENGGSLVITQPDKDGNFTIETGTASNSIQLLIKALNGETQTALSVLAFNP